MYFGVPGTCGTSVPSERLFSKAGEVVAATRSNIKPKNVDMIHATSMWLPLAAAAHGLCKTWTGMDWTGPTSSVQAANSTKATTGWLQLCFHLISSTSRPPIRRAQRPCAHLISNHKLQLHSQMTEDYSFCFLHFNKGWSVVSAQNNSFKQAKHSYQSSIKASQRCLYWMQVMDAQSRFQNPQGVSQSYLCWTHYIRLWPLTSQNCEDNASVSRKQLEAVPVGGVCCLYTAVPVCPVVNVCSHPCVYMHTCTHIHVYVHMYAHSRVYEHMHARTHVCALVEHELIIPE